jgi:hypothetical protein
MDTVKLYEEKIWVWQCPECNEYNEENDDYVLTLYCPTCKMEYEGEIEEY